LKTIPAFKVPQDKPFYVLAILLTAQVLFAYLISKCNIPDNAFTHLMYIPIVLTAFFFDYRIGILSGVIAELLINVFVPTNLDLFHEQRLYASLLRSLLFCLSGLLVGLMKKKKEDLAFRIKSAGIHPYTQLPYWQSLVDDMEAMTEEKKIIHFRFFLIEISNQNEIMATFGLRTVDQINQFIIYRLRDRYKNNKLFLIRLNTFALILPEVHQDIEELVRLFELPVVVNGIPIYCEVTIGEASYPESGQTPDDILRNGFIALNEARLHQKPYQQYYAKLYNPEVPILLGQFQNAIQNNEIEFHYQPIVKKSGAVSSLEALVRWNHPVKGQIPPDQFIPDLEFTRITNILTYYSLEYNLENMERLSQEGFDLGISVNISITNLFQPDFSDRVISILKKHHFPSHHLSLEITERGFLADDPECGRNLESLLKFGVKLSIDDFGVGFTSISNFRNKGINAIKIDKSFVEDIHTNLANQAILEGVIAIAKASGVIIIAEGIEKKAEKEKLLKLGVDCLQGYLISRPLSFNDIRLWLADHASRRPFGKRTNISGET